MAKDKGKNVGEWSEAYVFFKLLSDRKIYVADKNMIKLKDVFLNIISIIREEQRGKEYRYYTGDMVRITLNGSDVLMVDSALFTENMNKVWEMIRTKKNTTFMNQEILEFLSTIFIERITSPAQKKSDFFGGTADIVLDTMDYRSGVDQIMAFSCKSDIEAASTLFNASGDNTNFEYELLGDFNDDMMRSFNGIFKKVIRKGKEKNDVATGDRMAYLKSKGIELKFVKPVMATAKDNLVRCGGLEMPAMIGEMLRYYYYDCPESTFSVDDTIKHLAKTDPVGYGFSNLYDTYKTKVANLLYAMFTGLRFSKAWSGRSEVSGGYIVVKYDGDVVAFHSCIVDEFKDFLVDKLRFEAPSCSRHKYMQIYKADNRKYYLKLALQFRFKLQK